MMIWKSECVSGKSRKGSRTVQVNEQVDQCCDRQNHLLAFEGFFFSLSSGVVCTQVPYNLLHLVKR